MLQYTKTHYRSTLNRSIVWSFSVSQTADMLPLETFWFSTRKKAEYERDEWLRQDYYATKIVALKY